jgi:hypothetical protein
MARHGQDRYGRQNSNPLFEIYFERLKSDRGRRALNGIILPRVLSVTLFFKEKRIGITERHPTDSVLGDRHI